MRLTNREVELNNARQQGKRSFKTQYDMPDYKGDKGLEQAWNQGYQLARKEYNSFYSSYD